MRLKKKRKFQKKEKTKFKNENKSLIDEKKKENAEMLKKMDFLNIYNIYELLLRKQKEKKEFFGNFQKKNVIDILSVYVCHNHCKQDFFFFMKIDP